MKWYRSPTVKCETASTKMQFRNEKKKKKRSTLMNIDMTRGQRSLCNLKNSLFPKEKTTPNALSWDFIAISLEHFRS